MSVVILHFADGETEAQSSQACCPNSRTLSGRGKIWAQACWLHGAHAQALLWAVWHQCVPKLAPQAAHRGRLPTLHGGGSQGLAAEAPGPLARKTQS